MAELPHHFSGSPSDGPVARAYIDKLDLSPADRSSLEWELFRRQQEYEAAQRDLANAIAAESSPTQERTPNRNTRGSSLGCLTIAPIVVIAVVLVGWFSSSAFRSFVNNSRRVDHFIAARIFAVAPSGENASSSRTKLSLITAEPQRGVFLVDEGVRYSSKGKPIFASKKLKATRAKDFPAIKIGGMYDVTYSKDFMFGKQFNVTRIHASSLTSVKFPPCSARK